MPRYILFYLLLLLSGFPLLAQSPIPAADQVVPIAITGATAHLGNGEVIENALVAFAEGKFTIVADQTIVRADISDHQVIDGTGKHLYPGLIATNTQLGLTEISAVRATHDENETGSFNPNSRTLIAYNTDSQVTPTVRSRGVLYAQIAPTGGAISGSSSIVKLDAWNWEDATIHTDEGLHVNWPRRRYYSWRSGGWSINKKFDEQVTQIKEYFTEAKAYCNGGHEEKNLRLAAACGLFSGEQRLYCHVDQAADIEQAILLGKELAVTVVVVGGSESYLLTDLLKETGVSVILGPTHALPNNTDSDVNQRYKTPAMLHEAGVQFCLSNEGYWQQRNLPYQAGSAVAYGLPYEQAIQAITLDAARILGVDDQIGSIEEGKSASLILTEGDVLDMRSSQVIQAFIDGRDIDLDNKQEVLYRKFKTKYDRQ